IDDDNFEEESDAVQTVFNTPALVAKIRRVFTATGVATHWKDSDIQRYFRNNLPSALRDTVIQVAMESAFYATSIAKGEAGLSADAVGRLSELSTRSVKRRIGPGKRRSKPR